MTTQTLMLSVLNKERQIDCPQPENEVYFNDLDSARIKGVELCARYNVDIFIVRKLTTGKGHYRTLGYFNSINEYVR